MTECVHRNKDCFFVSSVSIQAILVEQYNFKYGLIGFLSSYTVSINTDKAKRERI